MINSPRVGQDDPLLTIKDLRVRVSASGTALLDGVNLSVARGEIIGLVGESGCGKSLTAASILNLLPPGLSSAGGEIAFADAAFAPKPGTLRSPRIALIPQEPQVSLNPLRTVGIQVAEPLMVHSGLSKRKALEEVARLFDEVGVTRDRINAYPFELSGGLCQRVAIARALAARPSLILADEPTTALDARTQARILELLADLRDRLGVSIILVTHDLGVVAEIADRVAVMYCGRVVETAPAANFFGNPAHPYSRGLLASIPSLHSRKPVAGLPGTVPSMDTLPQGCAFAPRCAHASTFCKEERPQLAAHPHDPDRGVSCFHPRLTTMSADQRSEVEA